MRLSPDTIKNDTKYNVSSSLNATKYNAQKEPHFYDFDHLEQGGGWSFFLTSPGTKTRF